MGVDKPDSLADQANEMDYLLAALEVDKACVLFHHILVRLASAEIVCRAVGEYKKEGVVLDELMYKYDLWLGE